MIVYDTSVTLLQDLAQLASPGRMVQGMQTTTKNLLKLEYPTLYRHKPRGVIVRAILGLLRVYDGATASKLAKVLGIPSRWIASLLRYWIRVGLVTRTKLGSRYYYELAGEALEAPEEVFWEWIETSNIELLVKTARETAKKLLEAKLGRKAEPEEALLIEYLAEAHTRGRKVIDVPAQRALDILADTLADYARRRGIKAITDPETLTRTIVELRNLGIIMSSVKRDRKGARLWLKLSNNFLMELSKLIPLHEQ